MTKFLNWLGIKITSAVGTMWCALVFACIAFISLPKTLASHDPQQIVSWVAQTFLQLVLLSIIMVGQTAQSVASDARHDRQVELGNQRMDVLIELIRSTHDEAQVLHGTTHKGIKVLADHCVPDKVPDDL